MTCVALIELTNAREIQDREGPQSWQLAQQEYISRLRQWVRPGDQSRILQEDRFLAVLRHVSGAGQIKLAGAKLAALFEKPLDLFGQTQKLQVCAGFAEVRQPRPDQNALIQAARGALAQARERGELYRIFDPDAKSEHQQEQTLLNELHRAVEQGEFILHYQPKVHAGYRTVVGAEALMRWQRHGKKLSGPGDFIDVAERHPIIAPMTWWALKSAIGRARLWPDTIGVAVNVTPSLLLSDELRCVIQDALDMHGIAPGRLTVEVTESVMSDDPGRMLDQLNQLRHLGVRVAIDDFGTGYSSLTYFRDLPADELKIDKSFVMPMSTSRRDAAIVRSVIDLAHHCGLRVVAEGVEDEKTGDMLRELGCDVLQGFAFGAPLPVEDFERHHCRNG